MDIEEELDETEIDFSDGSQRTDEFIDSNMKKLFDSNESHGSMTPSAEELDSSESNGINQEEWTLDLRAFDTETTFEAPVFIPFVAEVIEVQSKTAKKRGRPPIKDPIVRKLRKQERERVAAKKYRHKKKLFQQNEDNVVFEWTQKLDDKRRELEEVVTQIQMMADLIPNIRHLFTDEEETQLRESFKIIGKQIE